MFHIIKCNHKWIKKFPLLRCRRDENTWRNQHGAVTGASLRYHVVDYFSLTAHPYSRSLKFQNKRKDTLQKNTQYSSLYWELDTITLKKNLDPAVFSVWTTSGYSSVLLFTRRCPSGRVATSSIRSLTLSDVLQRNNDGS